MTDKRTLRTELRARRDAFDRSGTITTSPAFLTRLAHGLTLASYVPIDSEADPSPLARAATEAGLVIALPHVVNKATPLRFLAWDTEAALAAGPFGLSQPHHEAEELRPDIILTPLVGFDRRGNRIGQGAGYYDRAFARFPDVWRVGVAWSCQEVPAFDPDPWDVPLHVIATEREWIVP